MQTTQRHKISQKILMLLAERGWHQSDLARTTGIKHGTINAWVNKGSKPEGENLIRLARGLSVTPEYLMDDTRDYPPGKSDRIRPQPVLPEHVSETTVDYGAGIPVVGHVRAGKADIIFDDAGLPVGGALEYVRPPEDLKDPNAYGLIVKGDSMLPAFKDGTVVILSRRKEVRNNDLAVCVLTSGEVYFKRVEVKDRIVVLKSDNPAEDTITVERKNIRLLDKVVWIRPA